MLKDKYILSVSLYMVCLFLAISLFSCNKENLITPPPNPSIIDSNFFDWYIDTIQVYPGFDMYIADTNKIIIPGYPYSVFYNNGSIQYINHNDNDFDALCANGTDINNVYIGGVSRSAYKSKLKKWTGGSVEDIIMPIDSSNEITRIEIISQDEIWMSTIRNIIYHYSNHSVTTYILDNGLVNGTVYIDNFQNLYSCYIKQLQGPYPNYLLYMFKFENNSWIQIWKDSVSENSEMSGYTGYMDNKLLRAGKSGLYSWTGNNWTKIINFETAIHLFRSCGKNTENILFEALEEISLNDGLYFFDGKLIYRQPNRYIPSISFNSLKYKFDRYYFALYGDMQQNYFGIAKFKK